MFQDSSEAAARLRFVFAAVEMLCSPTLSISLCKPAVLLLQPKTKHKPPCLTCMSLCRWSSISASVLQIVKMSRPVVNRSAFISPQSVTVFSLDSVHIRIRTTQQTQRVLGRNSITDMKDVRRSEHCICGGLFHPCCEQMLVIGQIHQLL